MIVFLQGILPFLTLVFSGVKASLEESVIRMDNHTVENRQVVLENEMVEKWRSIYKESDGLSQVLSGVLKENDIDIRQFLKSPEIQQEYLDQVFPNMVETLQYNTTSGLFLVLANDSALDQEASYKGFFIRDSDPQTKTATNADLLLERGSKELAHRASISLDNAWSTNFSFKGADNRSADDFFYKPYIAAVGHTDTAMVNLGYWAEPFVLEDHTMDNHWMITYSVPLMYDGTIYGVVGIEISINYLGNYFPVKDLDSNLNAGYALLVDNGEGRYHQLAGKGALYDAVSRDRQEYIQIETTDHDILKVKDARVGNQEIYAVLKPLDLYSNNVPYENTRWVLCGLVTEDSVFAQGEELYRKMVLAIACSMILAIVLVYILARHVTRPVKRLVESVRGGVKGIHSYKVSNIIEIDDLHDVVENLTDTQQRTEEQLREEKERYRIAVESSHDMFFTFSMEDQMLEIVNSGKYDGVWDCGKHPEWINSENIYEEDQKAVLNSLETTTGEINIDFRLREPGKKDYQWVNVSASLIQDENGRNHRIVGSVRNIHQQKQQEEERQKRHLYDPVTSCYRLTYGLEALQKLPIDAQKGVLVLTDIEKFKWCCSRYGLVFGDVIIHELAEMLRQQCRQAGIAEAVYIRAGASQILIWMPVTETEIAVNIMKTVRARFNELTNENYLVMDFKCGLTSAKRLSPVRKILEQTKIALTAARYRQEAIAVYQSLTGEERKRRQEITFGEIVSFEQIERMSLSSLALNLFERGGETAVILDVLALKLQETYGLTNLIVTRFNREYLSNTLTYHWKNTPRYHHWDGIVHCKGTEYIQFTQSVRMQDIDIITERMTHDPMVGDFMDERNGLVFHMKDNDQYSGSILFMGISSSVLQDEEVSKRFSEMGSVIQNRINLQRHDLSAKAKSDFLARMSHEIRTPMNGIIGMTEIALREGQSDERKMDCLRKIESSSTYLLGLLNDILDMSKIESGKMKLIQDKCHLSKLLQDLEALMSSRIEEKGLHYEAQIELVHEWFITDELRLNQILVNLLSNAVKYTNSGGYVCLIVKETCENDASSKVYFAVKDDGIGIAEDKQELIFRSFEQADDSERARKQGTGLGLAISSRLVHMMDSYIHLDSQPGKGSCFSFTLSLKSVDADAVQETAHADNLDFSGKRVLVVEDNALNMEITTTLLKDYGIITEEAHNGEEAVQCVKRSREGYYDLILMDIMMPVMDGLEATQAIRKLGRKDCKTIPIIAMSANAFNEDVRRSLASGMNGHLSKPVNIDKLEETLASVLG